MTKDTLPSPVFDELDATADEWMAECGVKEMVANIAVVFANWASPELLARFREQVEAIMHLSFVEGAIRSRDTLPSPVTLSTPDIEKLRELASEMLAALTALYEACERRANEEGGDFGDDIGPAAALADAAISKAALLDSLPSPVSVPEGDAREIARNIVADTLRFADTEPDNDACINHVVNMLTAALLSAESRARDTATRALGEALEVRDWTEAERDGMSAAFERASEKHGHYETLFAVGAWLLRHRAALSKTEKGGER